MKKDNTASVQALMDCMDNNNMNRNDTPIYRTSAYLTRLDKNAAGSVSLQFFSGQYSSFGPYVLFDETIKSFDIRFTEFKPQYQDFSYDAKLNELTIKGQNYEFCIENISVKDN